MMDDGSGMGWPQRLNREDWIRHFSSAMRKTPGDQGFGSEFTSHVVDLLEKHGFPNLGYAIICAGSDLSKGGSRVELDALVDLAMQVLTGAYEA